MIHKVQDMLERGQLKDTGQTFYSPTYGFMFGWGITVGNSVQGWAKGALFIDLDAATGAQFLINVGTNVTASWKTITSLDAANTWAALQTFTLGLTSSDVITASTGVLENTLTKVRTATQTITASVALTADDTLTATLIAGKAYAFEIGYNFTTVNTEGLKFDLNGGTATMTNIEGNTLFTDADATTSAFMNFGAQEFTSLTPTYGLTASGLKVAVLAKGALICNAGGTFIPRFAQNASGAGNLVAAIGSYMTVKRCS